MVRGRLAIGSRELILNQQPSEDHYSIPKKYSSKGVSLLWRPGVNLLRPEGVNLLRLAGVNLTGFCNLSYESIGENDNSVIDAILKVQKEFWENFIFYDELPDNKLFFQKYDEIEKFKVVFNCFNSAWMSKANEIVNLFFPIKLIEENQKIEKGDLNIALIHHPIFWFRPDGIRNNRKELAHFIEENSSLILFGHEHEEEFKRSTDFWAERQTVHFSGKIMQDEKHEQSGFSLIRINLVDKYSLVQFFNWKKDFYMIQNQSDFQLNGDIQATKRFKSNLEFLKSINKPKISISMDSDFEVSLTDIFVFPDLEKRERKSNSKVLEDLLDSEKLFLDVSIKKCIVEGENQSGKSSLLLMLYKKYLENDRYPLLIDGGQIKSINADNYLKSAFEKQYIGDEIVFQKFKQFNSKEKVLLIDNFHELSLPPKSIRALLEHLEIQFEKIIIFSNNLLTLVPQIEIEVKDLDTYTIRPLGYKKRNKLIENFHRLNPNNNTDDLIFKKTKDSFHKMNNVLGNKLLPSYPIFILSILQTLTHMNVSGLEQTSYGHCYHSLIYLALSKKAKISNDNIDTYFNFLSGFSLFFYNKKKSFFLESDLFEYYEIHSAEFHMTVSFENLKLDLVNSSLVIVSEDEWRFSYKYIFYFLVAKRIAELIGKNEGKLAIQYLCKNIHNEKNANILIFIAHHSKDDYLIQEATFTAMTPFENIDPITLNRNGKYYNIIKDIVEEICNNVIDSSKNPISNRDELLDEKDTRERLNENFESDDQEEEELDDISETMTSFYQAFRSIEIVGQIIKNRKGSISTDNLVQMIIELYNTAFRTISFFGSNLLETKDVFIERFTNEEVNRESKIQTEKRINSFFQMLALNVCLGVFGKIIYSVGQSDLKDLFIKAALKIDTPAADLVTFSINSFYGNLSKNELSVIVKKYEKNIVAMQIIKARVKSYIYQNNVDFKKKQAFASLLNMRIS